MLSSDRPMQFKELLTQHATRFIPLVVVTLALVVVSGCGQEKQAEKTPASRPSASVDFNDPGNRVDATFQPGSPE